MAFLQLPTEVLIQILEYVGTFFFREDIRRLTICKRWFQCASDVFFKHLVLTRESFQRLLSGPDWEKRLLFIRQKVESLDIEIKSDAGWDNQISFERDLSRAATVAQASWRLRALRIQALVEHEFRSYSNVSFSLIEPVLSMRNLTDLDLDLGTLPQSLNSPREPVREHVCPGVGNILDTIKRFRLRVRTMCEVALQSRNPDKKLRLSELYINLNHDHDWRRASATKHCARDHFNWRETSRSLKPREIEDQARLLVAQMSPPQKFRILSRWGMKHKRYSFDVMTGRRMVLAEHKGWEDDGKLILHEDEDDSDSEPEVLFRRL